MEIQNDIPKYKKKKASSLSKSRVKTKHKHEYVDCLLVEKEEPYKAAYCRVCGKVGKYDLFANHISVNGVMKVLNREEVFERYKDLERFEPKVGRIQLINKEIQ